MDIDDFDPSDSWSIVSSNNMASEQDHISFADPLIVSEPSSYNGPWIEYIKQDIPNQILCIVSIDKLVFLGNSNGSVKVLDSEAKYHITTLNIPSQSIPFGRVTGVTSIAYTEYRSDDPSILCGYEDGSLALFSLFDQQNHLKWIMMPKNSRFKIVSILLHPSNLNNALVSYESGNVYMVNISQRKKTILFSIANDVHSTKRSIKSLFINNISCCWYSRFHLKYIPWIIVCHSHISNTGNIYENVMSVLDINQQRRIFCIRLPASTCHSEYSLVWKTDQELLIGNKSTNTIHVVQFEYITHRPSLVSSISLEYSINSLSILQLTPVNAKWIIALCLDEPECISIRYLSFDSLSIDRIDKIPLFKSDTNYIAQISMNDNIIWISINSGSLSTIYKIQERDISLWIKWLSSEKQYEQAYKVIQYSDNEEIKSFSNKIERGLLKHYILDKGCYDMAIKHIVDHDIFKQKSFREWIIMLRNHKQLHSMIIIPSLISKILIIIPWYDLLAWIIIQEDYQGLDQSILDLVVPKVYNHDNDKELKQAIDSIESFEANNVKIEIVEKCLAILYEKISNGCDDALLKSSYYYIRIHSSHGYELLKRCEYDLHWEKSIIIALLQDGQRGIEYLSSHIDDDSINQLMYICDTELKDDNILWKLLCSLSVKRPNSLSDNEYNRLMNQTVKYDPRNVLRILYMYKSIKFLNIRELLDNNSEFFLKEKIYLMILESKWSMNDLNQLFTLFMEEYKGDDCFISLMQELKDLCKFVIEMSQDYWNDIWMCLVDKFGKEKIIEYVSKIPKTCNILVSDAQFAKSISSCSLFSKDVSIKCYLSKIKSALVLKRLFYNALKSECFELYECHFIRPRHSIIMDSFDQ